MSSTKTRLLTLSEKRRAGWLNATVGILVDPAVTFAGQKKGGVRLRALLPPAAAKPVAKPAAPKPATKPPAAATSEWKEEGDPGPDASQADFEPA